MSDNQPSGSAVPKAIGSLAKKQSDVTRQGTQKLKFTPTLPARRKKEDVKTETATSTVLESSNVSARGQRRGRGRVGGPAERGRGRGRGVAPLPLAEMTASGPFALGPALAGRQPQTRTTAAGPLRSDSTTILPTTPADVGTNLTRTPAQTLKNKTDVKGKGKAVKEEDIEENLYSDQDEGVEIIDMNRIREMDWMAPQSLQEERQKVKKELSDAVDSANAVDLSESEGEEELEDLIEDFAIKSDLDNEDPDMREDRLYFFQFPAPFPKFFSSSNKPVNLEQPLPESSVKKVSFAPDTKPPLTPDSSTRPSATPSEIVREERVDGVIGQLEVYKSGAVKIRLTNGILLDVNAASQPSFLQQAVHLNLEEKQLTVLGEVNKQFVISPDIDSLLEGMERADKPVPLFEGEEELIKMDIT